MDNWSLALSYMQYGIECMGYLAFCIGILFGYRLLVDLWS